MSVLDEIAVDGSLLDELTPGYKSTPQRDKAQKEVFAKVGPELERIFAMFRIDTKLRIAHFLGQCAVETMDFTSMTEWADGSKYEGTRVTYPGDGTTVVFLVAKPYLLEPAQLRVYLTNGAGVQTTLVRGTHYTVSGKGPSGKVTALSAPASGTSLTIVQSSLGNLEAGDGKKFKGRGLIQLTGRWNYNKANEVIHSPKYIKMFPGIADVDLVKNPEKAADTEWCLIISAIFWDYRNINPAAEANDCEGVTRLVNGPGMLELARRKLYTTKALALIEGRLELALKERKAKASGASAASAPSPSAGGKARVMDLSVHPSMHINAHSDHAWTRPDSIGRELQRNRQFGSTSIFPRLDR